MFEGKFMKNVSVIFFTDKFFSPAFAFWLFKLVDANMQNIRKISTNKKLKFIATFPKIKPSTTNIYWSKDIFLLACMLCLKFRASRYWYLFEWQMKIFFRRAKKLFLGERESERRIPKRKSYFNIFFNPYSLPLCSLSAQSTNRENPKTFFSFISNVLFRGGKSKFSYCGFHSRFFNYNVAYSPAKSF